MKGKETIINSILSEAQAKADAIVAEAQAKADEILKNANEQADADMKAAMEQAEKEAKDISDRRVSVAELEGKKYLLSLKQNLLSDCFEDALKKLCSMPDKQYLQIISSLLSYAEDGESVVISCNDEKRITSDFVKSNVKGKKVSLSSERGDFSGGIVLSKDGYDKNMTFEVLLKQVREECEAEVAALLFKE